MSKYYLSAYALTNEFNLNAIAQHFNIHKKFNWEDHLILSPAHLHNIIGHSKTKYAYIYSFGSIVLINFTDSEKQTFIKFLDKIFNTSPTPFSFNFYEDYTLEVNPNSKLQVSNNYTVCPVKKEGYIELLSLILGQSVALDKIEDGIDQVMDEVENIIDFLKKGKLNIKDKSLAKLLAKILELKFAPISHIMLLDKPDITWENAKYDEFYYELVELFEIEDRYNKMKSKLGILMDITEVFSTLSHERRSARLEWIIIILIAVEFAVALIELFFKL